jgi:Protein of unknown function (DUF3485)
MGLNMNNATIAARNETSGELPVLSQPVAKLEWRWIALICMLLVISGAIRYWRDWHFQSLSRGSEMLFPLNEFPKVLGSWHVEEGSEERLEPEIARIAGASDHLIQAYVDEKSGERAVVMIIYGLARRVWPHVPGTCYPAIGFKTVPPQEDLDIQIPGTARKARFRMERFVKYMAGQRDYREVYHSFRNAGEWGIDMANNWKIFRYHPGMFKVQVQHQGSSSVQTGEGDPVDQLLGLIVSEIDRRATQQN